MAEAKRKPKGKKPHRSRRILIGLLVTAGLIALVILLVLHVFVIKTVTVVGNELYSDEQIEEWVLDEDYSWNTMYVMLREEFRDELEIPFLEDVEVTLISPTEIQIDVTEKEVNGYLYVSSIGKNAYFNSDGVVVELSNDIIEGAMKICGFDIEAVEIGEQLDLGGTSMSKSLLSLTQLLKKNDCVPELIYVQNSSILLCYGEIQVNLGRGSDLSEKILRVTQILPQLTGESGTLHMENWNESSTDFYFNPGQIVTIPSD